MSTSPTRDRDRPSAWTVTCQYRPNSLKLVTYSDPRLICIVWLTSVNGSPRLMALVRSTSR